MAMTNIDWKREIGGRLAGLTLEPTREAEIVEELSQHLEARYTESLTRGATSEEACRAALAELGESELLAKELRRGERPEPGGSVVLGSNKGDSLIGGHWEGFGDG